MLRVKQSKDSFPWFQSLGTGNMCPEHPINLKPMSSLRIGYEIVPIPVNVTMPLQALCAGPAVI
jgi:hypothetical protein